MDQLEPIFAIETITPQLAELYLQKNTKNNRKVTKKTVGNYAADMSSGNWRLSPDCIAFDEHDHLINGQHRMEAVISCGKPVKFAVLRKFPKDSMQCFDIGKRRQIGYLYHGFNKFFVIAAIKIACLTKSKLTYWSGRNAELMITSPNVYQAPTIRALQFLEIIKTGYLEKTGVFNAETDKSALAVREMYMKHKATGRNWASFPALNISNSAGFSFAMNESRSSVKQTINDPFEPFFDENVCTNQIIYDDARGYMPDSLSPEIKGLIVKYGDYV